MISACCSRTARTPRRSCSRLKQWKVKRVEIQSMLRCWLFVWKHVQKGQLGQLAKIKHLKNELWGQIVSLDLPHLSLESECLSGLLAGCTWRQLSFHNIFCIKGLVLFQAIPLWKLYAWLRTWTVPACHSCLTTKVKTVKLDHQTFRLISKSRASEHRLESPAISLSHTFTDKPSSCQGFPSHDPLSPWELNECVSMNIQWQYIMFLSNEVGALNWKD